MYVMSQMSRLSCVTTLINVAIVTAVTCVTTVICVTAVICVTTVTCDTTVTDVTTVTCVMAVICVTTVTDVMIVTKSQWSHVSRLSHVSALAWLKKEEEQTCILAVRRFATLALLVGDFGNLISNGSTGKAQENASKCIILNLSRLSYCRIIHPLEPPSWIVPSLNRYLLPFIPDTTLLHIHVLYLEEQGMKLPFLAPQCPWTAPAALLVV